MKKNLLAAAVASTLLAGALAALPAGAIEQGNRIPDAAKSPVPILARPAVVPPPPARPPISAEALAAFAAIAKELSDAAPTRLNMVQQLDAYSKFEFSPALRSKVQNFFGTDRPFRLERTPDVKGRISYAALLPAHSYHLARGGDISWAELRATFSTDKAGRTLHSGGVWPSLTIGDDDGGFAVKDMSFTGNQTRAADGVWYGDLTMRAAHIVQRSKMPGASAPQELFHLDDVRVDSGISRRGKTAEIAYGFSVGTVVAGGVQVDRANIGLRVVNLSAQSFAQLTAEVSDPQRGKLPPDAQHVLMARTLKDFGKAAIRDGATLMIDDISAAYRGNTASIKGSVGLVKMLDADFDDLVALSKKLVIHLDVRLPVALIDDVARLIASRQIKASEPDAAAQIDIAAKKMSASVVDKLVSDGFARREKGELRSAIDIVNSKLTFNGKVVPLPGMPDGVIPVPAKPTLVPGRAPLAVPPAVPPAMPGAMPTQMPAPAPAAVPIKR